MNFDFLELAPEIILNHNYILFLQKIRKFQFRSRPVSMYNR